MDQRVRRILAFAIASAIISFALHCMMRSSAGQTIGTHAVSGSRSGMSSDRSAMMDRLDDAVNVSKEMGFQGPKDGTQKSASDVLKGLSN